MLADGSRSSAAQPPIDVIMQVDHGSRWLHLVAPVRVIEAWTADEVPAALRDVAELTTRSGYHAAGFVAYEAGAAFGLDAHAAEGSLPLAWFALFDAGGVRQIDRPSASEHFEIGALRPSVAWPEFRAAIERIKSHLADGDSYQVNYTLRLRGILRGDAYSFFAELAAAQQGRYSALLRLGAHTICSASPELFFARTGSRVVARPMKGTSRRGRGVAEDDARARELRNSEKDRAENVMIVDMVRNDLGRVAATGSVAVRKLFAIERYPTLWQMTSEVTAKTDAGLPEMFAAMFPSASITGAPKHRTMRIIRELETDPRGVYTGAIGYVAPGGAAQFNVAIRTAVIENASGRLTFGIGSGIVWDSDPAGEYDECLLKADVLRRRTPAFDLLETLQWRPERGFFLLARHLQRLQASARYFGMKCPLADVRAALDRAITGSEQPLRVRLLLDAGGGVRTECTPLEPVQEPVHVRLAAAPIDRSDLFLFHKTTNRTQYEQAQRPGAGETLLWNEKRQVTESTIANVVVDLGGRLVTPPIECGLLAGTFRAELLDQGAIHEAPVTIEELERAPRFWLINSVREWRAATLR